MNQTTSMNVLESKKENICVHIREDIPEARCASLLDSTQSISSPERIDANSSVSIGPQQERETDFEAQRRNPQLERKSLLENFFQKTGNISHLRKSFVVLLSVFLSSYAALEMKETEKLMIALFAVGYLCLIYQAVEDAIQYVLVRSSSNNSERVEHSFKVADKVLLVVFLFTVNLQYCNYFNKSLMFVAPLLFLGEIVLYSKKSTVTQNQKDVQMIWKLCYLFQSSLIAAKMTDFISCEWEGALFFVWIYLAINTCYAIFGALLCISVGIASLTQLNARVFNLLQSKAIYYVWYICCHALNGIAFMILIGLFQQLGSGKEDLLHKGLEAARKLSAFLLICALIWLPILKLSGCSSPFQDFGFTFENQNQYQVLRETSRKNYQLKAQSESKSAFFLMLSPTYFTLLKEGSQPPTEEDVQKIQEKIELNNSDHIVEFDDQYSSSKKGETKEDGLCYICENNKSNAILIDCGHGGICCACAVKTIEQKNECMGCRKPITAIYQIDDNQNPENIKGVFKASETIQVIKID